jgi:hypothetical protein
MELGLSPDTADMCYPHFIRHGANTYDEIPEIAEEIDYPYEMPCWSLGALLDVMPPYLFEFERGIDLNIYCNLNGKGWHVSYMPNNIESMQKDKFRQITNGETPIDAAYNMVVWLLENGYIKK